MNKELVDIFNEIADILEIKKVEWKPMVYRRAARSLESLERDVKEIYKKEGIKGLDKIPGVGKSISKKIEEYIKTKKIKSFNKLKKSIPKGLTELMDVEGIGAKKAGKLYKKLKIKSVKDLEKAIKKNKLKNIEGFGKKSEEDIKENVEFFKRKKGSKRVLLGDAYSIAENIIEKLNIKKVVIAGSLRRMEETVGDIDLLIIDSNGKDIINNFSKLGDKVLAKGNTKGIILIDKLQCDLRVVDKDEFGSALQYFTGNKDHNIALRKIAIKHKMKLNEYGLFKGKKRIVKNEEDIYKKLNVNYVPAELREGKDELKKSIPKLVGYNDIKGDLQVHTKWSDGNNTVLEMAKEAKRLKYKYIGITDHSKARAIAGGLKEKDVLKQIKEIKKVKVPGIRILKGIEVDILASGDLDYKDNILKKLDFVVGAVHSGFSKDCTNRIVNALENKYVDIIAHPTGRLINQREGYKVNLNEVFKVAKREGKYLEVNADPHRLDLNGDNIKKAIEKKVKLVINTDAHSIEGLHNMKFGVGQARRGWSKKEDIINCGNFIKANGKKT